VSAGITSSLAKWVARAPRIRGKRGFTGASFICIPPGSAVVYRTIVYIIMFMLAGLALKKLSRA
jgi:hypothetical protein